MITNRPKCFQNSVTLETGLSGSITALYKNKSQPLSHTAALNIFLMRSL